MVTWPNGHETHGVSKHIDDLKAMFVFAPDIAIKTHPIRFGSGMWTAVTGVVTGTFTKPMTMPDGTSISPTGKLRRDRSRDDGRGLEVRRVYGIATRPFG